SSPAVTMADGTCPQCGARLGHLASGLCPACASETTRVDGVSTHTVASVTAVPGVRIRYIGDYELVEEVARGGLGLVFQPRQISLNRIVAVKMILSGHLADEEQVRSFRAEAEAAASLQHPNIVAIHEVGEYGGEHYFSMDFVEGQNLAQLAQRRPLPS